MEPIDVSDNKADRPSRIIWERAESNICGIPDRMFHARLDRNWIFPVTAIIEEHVPDADLDNPNIYQVVFVCGNMEVRFPQPAENLPSLKATAADWLYGDFGLNLYSHIYKGLCEGQFFPAQFASVSDKYQLSKLMGYDSDAAD